MLTRRRTLTAAQLSDVIAREARYLSDWVDTDFGLSRKSIQIHNLEQLLEKLRDPSLPDDEHQAIADNWTLFRRKIRWTLGITSWLLLWPTEYTIRPKQQKTCELE